MLGQPEQPTLVRYSKRMLIIITGRERRALYAGKSEFNAYLIIRFSVSLVHYTLTLWQAAGRGQEEDARAGLMPSLASTKFL